MKKLFWDRFLYKEGFLTLLCLFITTGCVSTNPATGKQHLSFVSEEKEYEIGQEVYGDIVKSRGGMYKESKKLTNYINNRLKDIVAVSERADKPFKMTILDENIFNAAAIPGYIFISRGILPFLHNEAQLVSILGHEVGHVTAMHTARKQTSQTIAAIGQTLLGAYISYNTQGVPAGREIMQATDLATNYLFANYSRSYEEEADRLAVRYLTKLKYDPYAASDSFSVMDKHSQYTEKLYEQAGIKVNRSIFHRLLNSHPEDKKRIKDTMEEAATKGPRSYLVHRDRYLDAINGMSFGPKLKDYGVAKRNIFIHPKHRFSFYIPEGYITPQAEGLPTAFNPKTSRVLGYDFKTVPEDEDAEESLIYNYKKIQNVTPIQLGNIEGYTGIITGKDTKTGNRVKSRIVGFKGKHSLTGEKQEGKKAFYGLVFLANEKDFKEADKEFMKIANSIKLLTKAEAKKVEPLYVHIYTTKAGDTQKSLAEKMGFSADRLTWFHLINDIKPSDKLLPGMRLKLIY